MKDLAPNILRQRLVIEGYPSRPVTPAQIEKYLGMLSKVLKMRSLRTPVTNRSPKFGWAGWIHWETSGAHFYGWLRPVLFFSVDIYTCKAFDQKAAVEFTREFFSATEVVYKNV